MNITVHPDTDERTAITKVLDVEAVDNHGNRYPVHLTLGKRSTGQMYTEGNPVNPPEFQYRWALHIQNTPGGWYIATLLSDGGLYTNGISIDSGQDWTCVNFQEVLDEARKHI